MQLQDCSDAPASQRREHSTQVVRALGLGKSYSKRGTAVEVIRDLDFEVGPGEFVSIIGLSGCGKSTLLKVLAGLTPYQTGTVEVLGQRVNGPRRDVGFVFQHLALLPWRRVLGNVMLPAELSNISRSAALERAHKYISMVGLEGYESYHIREISGGMQQRVALARVLMTDSPLLMLDEPFGALDELTRESVSALFLDVCEQSGAATMLVTHSIQEAVLMGDRILVMPQTPDHPPKWIAVDLPRPRSVSMVTDETFLATVTKVRRALGLMP